MHDVLKFLRKKKNKSYVYDTRVKRILASADQQSNVLNFH